MTLHSDSDSSIDPILLLSRSCFPPEHPMFKKLFGKKGKKEVEPKGKEPVKKNEESAQVSPVKKNEEAAQVSPVKKNDNSPPVSTGKAVGQSSTSSPPSNPAGTSSGVALDSRYQIMTLDEW